MQEINASDFKAQCLAILDKVARTGEPVLIYKRGKPVAQLVPAPCDSYPQQQLEGSVTILGDILAPVMDSGDWDVESATL